MPSVIYDPKIEKLMESFVPANEREWWPWVWPEPEWYKKASKRQVNDFVEKVKHFGRTDLFFLADNILRNPRHFHLHIGLHDEICHILQFGGDVGILIPRNHLKSTLVSGAFPLWKLGNDPNLRIMICTAISSLAESLMSYLQLQILHNKKLQMVFPNMRPAMDAYTAKPKMLNREAILLERDMALKEPSVLSMGLDNQPKTGFHCDIMDYDDIVTHDNADTPEKLRRAKLNHEHSANLPDMSARNLYAGTRYNDLDIYGDLIKQKRIPFYVRKAVEDGEYCWPQKENVELVEQRRLKLSPYVFACQFMNDPIIEGDAEFEQSWVQRWDYDLLRQWTGKGTLTDEEVFEYWLTTLDIHQGCDPNRSDKKRSDFGVIMVMGVNKKGHEFGLFVKRKKMKTDEQVDEYIKAFEFWKPKTARCETIGGDIHVYNAIRTKMKEKELAYNRFGEYEKTNRMSGEDRIRELQFPLSQRMIWFGPGPEWDEIIQELLRFPYAAHDDGITTMAYIHSQQAKPKREKPKELEVGAWQNRLNDQYIGRTRDWQIA